MSEFATRLYNGGSCGAGGIRRVADEKRRIEANMLGHIGSPASGTVPVLTNALADQDTGVRESAAEPCKKSTKRI